MEEKIDQSTLKMSINHSFMSTSEHVPSEHSQPLLRQTKSSTLPSFTSNHSQVMQKKQISQLIQMKQQILVIRERISVIPRVADPDIVNQFKIMKQFKEKTMIKQKLKQKIQQKKKEFSKLKHLYAKSELQFDQKNQIFKQKSALLKVLGNKMDNQLAKTKQRYRQVQFNHVIVQGVRKLLYYRLCQIVFNQNIRGLFNIKNITNVNEQKDDDDSIGNCLGYLALFMSLVGTICGARMWINFTFRGPKSTIKLLDGTVIVLHPRQPRLGEAMKLLNEQLYQIMHDKMQIKVANSQNFYQLCDELSKEILSLK